MVGMFRRMGFSPILSSAATASSSMSTSWKFSRMREAVTLLGMTIWPSRWAQARMTWAVVTGLPWAEDRRSAMALTSGSATSSGRPQLLLPKAEYAVVRMPCLLQEGDHLLAGEARVALDLVHGGGYAGVLDDGLELEGKF